MKWQERTADELAPDLIEKYQLGPIAAKLFALRGINTDENLIFGLMQQKKIWLIQR